MRILNSLKTINVASSVSTTVPQFVIVGVSPRFFFNEKSWSVHRAYIAKWRNFFSRKHGEQLIDRQL